MSAFWKKVLTIGRFLRLPSWENASFQHDRAEWQAVFQDASLITDGPRQVEEAKNRIMTRLMRAYEVHEKLERRYISMLEGVINTIDFCEGLDPRPEEIEAVRHRLLGLLADHEVTPWSPSIGEPVPQGCEVIDVILCPDSPPGTVKKVPMPGYAWKDRTILRRPGVIVSKLPPKEVRPEEIHKEGHGEGAETPPEAAPEERQEAHAPESIMPLSEEVQDERTEHRDRSGHL